jgi:hypothetical protein
MARSRNIKPGFFSNEDLAECSFPARLCFAGLWTLADRDGRMEDRPKRIKGELFRFDSVEVELLLRELERYGFIIRYQIDGDRFIQVSKFSEHQTPHYSEKPSVIKPPPLQDDQPYEDSKTPREDQETPEVSGPSRGGRNPLIPDSLIPDSLIPEQSIVVVAGVPAVIAYGDPPPVAAGKPAAHATRPRKTGTRLPDDWALPKPWGEWALAEFPQWTPDKVRLEAAKFSDHWHAKTGAEASKLDWLATWRNWCRSDIAHRDDPKPMNGHAPRPGEPSGRLPLYVPPPPLSDAERQAAEAKRVEVMAKFRRRGSA